MSTPDPAARLRAYFPHRAPRGVLSAYLFGSQTEGRAHRESDVDVGILLDRKLYPTARERFDIRVRLGSELVHALGADEVDVVILNDAPPELGRGVATRGERVYCADPAADHAYVRDIQLRAADLAPFLRRTREIKLQALRS